MYFLGEFLGLLQQLADPLVILQQICFVTVARMRVSRRDEAVIQSTQSNTQGCTCTFDIAEPEVSRIRARHELDLRTFCCPKKVEHTILSINDKRRC